MRKVILPFRQMGCFNFGDAAGVRFRDKAVTALMSAKGAKADLTDHIVGLPSSWMIELRLWPQAHPVPAFRALSIARLRSGDMPGSMKWGRRAGEVPCDDVMIMINGLCANRFGGEMDAANRIAKRMQKAFPGTSVEDILRLNTQPGGRFLPV